MKPKGNRGRSRLVGIFELILGGGLREAEKMCLGQSWSDSSWHRDFGRGCPSISRSQAQQHRLRHLHQSTGPGGSIDVRPPGCILAERHRPSGTRPWAPVRCWNTAGGLPPSRSRWTTCLRAYSRMSRSSGHFKDVFAQYIVTAASMA